MSALGISLVVRLDISYLVTLKTSASSPRSPKVLVFRVVKIGLHLMLHISMQYMSLHTLLYT